MALSMVSPAFQHHSFIPVRYTCDGENISPPLIWKDVPDTALSLSLICDDPDAPVGTWVHWVIYDIPVSESGLPERVPAVDVLEQGIYQGINDFRKAGYGGPCPPGGVHRYFFKLYALDLKLGFQNKLTKKHLLEMMEGHVLEKTELVGKYSRS